MGSGKRMETLASYSQERIQELCGPYEDASACFLGKVFYLTRRRNAYWGRESLWRYSDFAATFSEAQRSQSSERGSQWSIVELPAFILASSDAALHVVPKPWISRAFDSLLRLRRIETAMIRLCPRLHALVADDAFIFVSKRELGQHASLPFCRHRLTRYSNSHLWVADRADCDLEPILRLVSKFTRLLQAG
jgi:hypothetical protein